MASHSYIMTALRMKVSWLQQCLKIFKNSHLSEFILGLVFLSVAQLFCYMHVEKKRSREISTYHISSQVKI